jgi:hypothetical protein
LHIPALAIRMNHTGDSIAIQLFCWRNKQPCPSAISHGKRTVDQCMPLLSGAPMYLANALHWCDCW